MKIKVVYFASLREESKLSEESIELESGKSVADLYELLKQKHNFSLDISKVKMAINDEYVDVNSELKDGNEVVFIPPVAGG